MALLSPCRCLPTSTRPLRMRRSSSSRSSRQRTRRGCGWSTCRRAWRRVSRSTRRSAARSSS
eukprot:5704849-Prymnesium_polylepis.1